ncbi:hypothetical protein OH77DRAFT_856160 [Trametes cingulata]|nr:hypothetical protein OH77DRAFT_856160 [Trametes cingulata]
MLFRIKFTPCHEELYDLVSLKISDAAVWCSMLVLRSAPPGLHLHAVTPLSPSRPAPARRTLEDSEGVVADYGDLHCCARPPESCNSDLETDIRAAASPRGATAHWRGDPRASSASTRMFLPSWARSSSAFQTKTRSLIVYDPHSHSAFTSSSEVHPPSTGRPGAWPNCRRMLAHAPVKQDLVHAISAPLDGARSRGTVV